MQILCKMTYLIFADWVHRYNDSAVVPVRGTDALVEVGFIHTVPFWPVFPAFDVVLRSSKAHTILINDLDDV